MRFEWDPPKAEATLTREDPAAGDEPRFVTLGLSNLANLIVVVLHVSRTGRDPVDFCVEGEQATEERL